MKVQVQVQVPGPRSPAGSTDGPLVSFVCPRSPILSFCIISKTRTRTQKSKASITQIYTRHVIPSPPFLSCAWQATPAAPHWLRTTNADKQGKSNDSPAETRYPNVFFCMRLKLPHVPPDSVGNYRVNQLPARAPSLPCCGRTEV